MSTEVLVTSVVMPELELIKVAAAKVGCELIEGKTRYKSFFNNNTQCDHVLHVLNDDGAFEAGLVWNKTGYSPRYDRDMEGGRRLERCIGKNASLLLEAYMQAGVEQYAETENY